MEDKRGKNQQEYEEEIARLVAAGKRLMAEANEITSAMPDAHKGSHTVKERDKKKHQDAYGNTQERGVHLGFWGNLCAMFMGHKLGSMTFEDDKTAKDVSDDFDHDSIDECIEEEEEF